ncbi:hypothetical protein X777_07251 [Ooceraea biroi]|uniref:Uncharacterized protein n=1 Tax=Ooceraea biroi TaxID=2015173 RepID=A0A026WAR6_OOCBI|nr:hypothetical protein X777_07251 [Ooceraea biroi]
MVRECISDVPVGEQSASKGREARFICEACEEPQLCGGTLSSVIRGGDRLSAVVRFGSNMSYVRNLFARMGNPAYVRLVTRPTNGREIGSHTVLHTSR